MTCRDRTKCRRLHGLRDELGAVHTVTLLAVVCTVGVVAIAGVASLGRRPAVAQTFVPCGGSAAGFLGATDVDVYTIDVPAGATGVVQGSLTSGDAGETLRIRVTGNGVDVETCSNRAPFDSNGGPQTVEVSTCRGGQGDYRINAQVISAGAANCGRLLQCGATPDGLELSEEGEVDSFRFPGAPGGVVEIRIDDLAGGDFDYLLQVFDPNGQIRGTRVCGTSIEVETESSRDYTLLVSSCGSLSRGEYRIERRDGRCPRGPVITTMALLRDDGRFVPPSAYDAVGRPIYESTVGRGTVMVEGRIGASLRPVGATASTPGQFPAFQAIVSRPLGIGNPAVCDQGATPPGGIAATTPLTFREDQASIDRINDFGCRVDDGAGVPVGRRDPLNSCERSSFSFVDPTTVIQFCAPIPLAEAFPPGDTVLAARMSDLDGITGAVREMVVRVPAVTVPTATFTPTLPPTATQPSATPTPTRRPTSPPATRPPGPCTCDCNLNREVTVAELIRCVLIALEDADLTTCEIGDTSGDGRVAIGELVAGVNNSLLGCPPPAGVR